jgi:hypothetical protein
MARLSVFDGRERVGHLIPRGERGIEAFDLAGRSLGIFINQRAAAAAIDKNLPPRAAVPAHNEE